MHIEDRSVQDLTQDPNNARGHDAKNVEAIVQSLEAFGQQKPIIIDKEGKVIAGNGTLQAAKQLGWKSIKAVVTRLEGANQSAYAIADNRTAELAHWNDEQLAETLAALENDDSIDAAITGFSSKDIDKMIESLADSGEIEEDEIPEDVDPVTKPGDLYLLGDHRLLCGDSTKNEDVAFLLDGAVADATVTDPPYGISYQSNHRKVKFDQLDNDDRILTGWVDPSMKHSTGWIVFFCAWQRLDEWINVGRDIGDLTNLLIWKKAAAMGDLTGAFSPTFEVALAYNRGSKLLCDGRPSAVFEYTIDSGSTFEHPTTKPVGLIADILRATTRSSVFDPFLGSGTTLIAAEQLGRRCFGMEIDPAYCDVIVKRWENLTGKKAERISAGG